MTMKHRIAICDDEQNQIEYITSIVASWSAHEGHSCEIRTFASAEASGIAVALIDFSRR